MGTHLLIFFSVFVSITEKSELKEKSSKILYCIPDLCFFSKTKPFKNHEKSNQKNNENLVIRDAPFVSFPSPLVILFDHLSVDAVLRCCCCAGVASAHFRPRGHFVAFVAGWNGDGEFDGRRGRRVLQTGSVSDRWRRGRRQGLPTVFRFAGESANFEQRKRENRILWRRSRGGFGRRLQQDIALGRR